MHPVVRVLRIDVRAGGSVADQERGDAVPDRPDTAGPGRRLTQRQRAFLSSAVAVFGVSAGIVQLLSSTWQTLLVMLLIVLSVGLTACGVWWAMGRGRQIASLSFRLLAALVLGAVLVGAGGAAGVQWMLARQAVSSQSDSGAGATRSPISGPRSETSPASLTSPPGPSALPSPASCQSPMRPTEPPGSQRRLLLFDLASTPIRQLSWDICTGEMTDGPRDFAVECRLGEAIRAGCEEGRAAVYRIFPNASRANRAAAARPSVNPTKDQSGCDGVTWKGEVTIVQGGYYCVRTQTYLVGVEVVSLPQRVPAKLARMTVELMVTVWSPG